MQSTALTAGTPATIQQYNKLRSDAKGAALLAPHEASTPAMSVVVEPGFFYNSSGTQVDCAGGTATIGAASANPRYDLVSINNSGSIVVTAGTPGASPVKPTLPANNYPICYVYVRVGTTVIRDDDQGSNGYIIEARPIMTSASSVSQAALDAKANLTGGNTFSGIQSFVGGAYIKGNPDGTLELGGYSGAGMLQTVALGEAVSSATPVAMTIVSSTSSINVIPPLSSNSGNADYIVSASSEYSAGLEAYKAFDGNDSDGWAAGNYITGPSWIKVQMTKKEVFKSVKLSGRSGTITLNSGWKVQASNDGFSTEIVDLYTGSSNVPGVVTEYTFTNNIGYFGYRIYATTHPVSGGLATLQLAKLSTGSMEFSNTLGSNIAGSRIKSGIVFRPKVTDVLGRVYTSQNATSSSTRVQLYQGVTLVAEKTPTLSTDYVDFTESVTKDTDYIICLNDSAYFNSQNNELILASYQANNPYCVSGYLNGATNVNPQNIRRIDFGTRKAMKATANSTAEYANFAGFISGTKAIGDSVDLNSNDLTLISGFSGLNIGKELYISNTPGVISTTQGSTISRLGNSVTSTQLVLDSQRTVLKKGTNLGSISINKATAGNVYANPIFFHGGSISWTFTSNYSNTTATSTLEFSIDGQNWTTLTTLTHSTSGTLTETSGGMYQKGYFRCGCNPGGAFTLTTSLTITT